jgi:DNA invertase Pin-like site-specific DNA recombinase
VSSSVLPLRWPLSVKLSRFRRKVIRLRLLRKGQVEGDGFDRHREAIAGYAAAHGIEIVRFFQEEGVSGTKDLENRPALHELMVALLSNGVGTVVIEKLDRLARDLMVQETILGDMRKNGFELLSVAEPDLCPNSRIASSKITLVNKVGMHRRPSLDSHRSTESQPCAS